MGHKIDVGTYRCPAYCHEKFSRTQCREGKPRDKECHFTIIKGSIHQKDISIPNIYALNNRMSKYMQRKLIEKKKKKTILQLYSELQHPYPSLSNRTSRQKISKDLEDLDNTVKQFDLIDIHRTCHPITAKNTFFSCAHRTFTKIDRYLGP